jgi:hypothetical protein
MCDLMMPVINGMVLQAEFSKAVRSRSSSLWAEPSRLPPKCFSTACPTLRVHKPFEAANIRTLVRALVTSAPRATLQSS